MCVKKTIFKKASIMRFKIKINKQKRVCDLILVIILILIYFIMGAIKVSPTRYVFKTPPQEIDWTIFRPKPSKTKVGNKKYREDLLDKTAGSENVNIIVPNLDFLSETTRKLKLGGKKYIPLKVPTGDKTSTDNISVASTDQIAQLSELDFSSKISRFPRNVLSSGNVAEGPSIEIETSPGLNMGVYSNDFGDMEISTGIPDEKAIPEPDVIKIELRKDEVNVEERDISPLINELILWMKDHSTPFSSVVKRFMNYEKGNLTSQVKIRINNRVYDLYLLCKENILEVRICLVAGDKSILLIDSGFKETSNYLRKGAVKRSANNKISSFMTRQQTPTEVVTKEFYQIFLSWWDTIKTKS